MIEIFNVIKDNWSIILTLAGILASVFWLKMDTRYVKKTDFYDLNEKFNTTTKRVDEIESEIVHLPTAKDISDLRLAVVEMKGETKSLNVEVKGLAHQVQLLIEKEVGKSNGN